MNWLSKLNLKLLGATDAAQPSQGDKKLVPEMYDIRCVCTNCGWGYPDGAMLSLESGVPISRYLCSQCGCNKLKAVATARQKPPKSPKPPKRSQNTYAPVCAQPAAPAAPQQDDPRQEDLVTALKRMGYGKSEAVRAAREVIAANPSASVEDLLRTALQEGG